MKRIAKILTVFSLMFCSLLFVAIGYYAVATKGVALQPEKLLLPEKNVTVYDGKGISVNGISKNFRQNVAFADIPTHTVRAFVDIEDKRFFSHAGYDFKRIVKSAYNNLKSRSFQQGASTISQQLVKNTHLSQEKTMSRKLKEWKLTRTLEKRYSKQEIFEKYVNAIYFGHDCFGLHAASNFYFQKQPQELDLADSAILAGLVKSPNNYSPFKYPDNCRRRKATVLSAMRKNGSISMEQEKQALEKPLPENISTPNGGYDYLHFVFDELSSLSETHGFTVGGKIEIKTYLNQNLQRELMKTAKTGEDCDKTFAVLDVETGGFKGYFSTVGNIPRLPGSLLKPLLVYAPAIEKGVISPATPILDEKVNYHGYSPENYDGKYHGYVSARECLAQSLNIPAVKILESVGIEQSVGFMEKAGLPVEKNDRSLALALGGMKRGYPLHALVSAYACFADGGAFTPSTFIQSVCINEHCVFSRRPQKTRVFSEETAYLLSDMLQTTAQTGTAKKLRSLPFQIAAKTGTVGTDKGNTDAYALSYTSRDVVGVWHGNADNSFIESTGGGTPCNANLHINEFLAKEYATEKVVIGNFIIPQGVQRVDLDKPAYYDTHTILLADKNAPIEYRFTELFKMDELPQKTSDFFSNPRINAPILEFDKGKVIILFPRNAPVYYQYKIERYDYATHKTLYFGECIPSFTDDGLSENKNYVYSVTPYFNGKAGEKITLPTVTTKHGQRPSIADNEIVEKDWWKY